MNNLLQLKGQLTSISNKSSFDPLSMPPNKTVSCRDIQRLAKQIKDVIDYWENGRTEIEGTLISVHYNTVVAKSNRLRALLKVGNKVPSENICGAKFERVNGKICHVFTYYVPLEVLKNAVNQLEITERIIQENFSSGEIKSEDFNTISSNKQRIDLFSFSKTNFLSIILDAYYVRKFAVEEVFLDVRENMLVMIKCLMIRHYCLKRKNIKD